MTKDGDCREFKISDAETKSGSPPLAPPVGVLDKDQMNNAIKIGHIQSAIIDFLIGNRINVNVENSREAIKNIVNGYAWLSDLILSIREIDEVVQGAIEEYEDAFKRQKVEKIIRERDRKFNEIESMLHTIDDLKIKIDVIKKDQIPEINKMIAEAENEYDIKIVERKEIVTGGLPYPGLEDGEVQADGANKNV